MLIGENFGVMQHTNKTVIPVILYNIDVREKKCSWENLLSHVSD